MNKGTCEQTAENQIKEIFLIKKITFYWGNNDSKKSIFLKVRNKSKHNSTKQVTVISEFNIRKRHLSNEYKIKTI